MAGSSMTLSVLFFCISSNGIFGLRLHQGVAKPAARDDVAVGRTDPRIDEFGGEQSVAVDEKEISFDLDPKSTPMSYLVEYNPNFEFSTFFSEIPDVIVQYGVQRTATTLQFQSLCAIMELKHPGEVDCKFVNNKTENWLATTSGKKYSVFKTHEKRALAQLSNKTQGHRFWLFVTSDESPNSTQLAESLKVQPQYIQSFPLLKSQGMEILADYAPIFKMSLDEEIEFFHYMQPWSLLRQCCGSQQSKTHRRVLWGDLASSEDPACDGQDLDAVESELIHTRIFQQMRKDDIKQDKGQPDPHFDGGYCTWFNRQVACKHLEMDQHPQPPFC